MSNNNNAQKKDVTLSDVVIALARNQESLDEISMWLKIAGTEKVIQILKSSLNSSEKKMVYHLSDGKSSREINVVCGVSIGSISNYWNSWYKLGLIGTKIINGKEKYVKNFNLEDYGIEVPKIIPKQETQQATTMEQSNTEGQINVK